VVEAPPADRVVAVRRVVERLDELPGPEGGDPAGSGDEHACVDARVRPRRGSGADRQARGRDQRQDRRGASGSSSPRNDHPIPPPPTDTGSAGAFGSTKVTVTSAEEVYCFLSAAVTVI